MVISGIAGLAAKTIPDREEGKTRKKRERCGNDSEYFEQVATVF
jgi:hypothetical protein